MTALTGRFSIDIELSSAVPRKVHIASSRPVHASRVLAGKTVDEAMQLLPMLFSICGTAQACAGVRACEAALGIPWNPRVECQRELLVMMEALREHLWRLFLDWPAHTKTPAERTRLAAVIALHKKYQAILDAEQQLFVAPGIQNSRVDEGSALLIVQDLGDLVNACVFGSESKSWLAIENIDALKKWAESTQTVAADLIAYVLYQEWQDVGRCSVDLLPPLDNTLLQTAFDDPHFVEAPTWEGGVRETNACRRIDSPLLEKLRADFGNGLLVRLVARLTEIAWLLDDLHSWPVGTCSHVPGDDHPENPGIGQAVAARGQLVHRVLLQNNMIENYQILAPTEWNFHPEGVVSKALLELQGEISTIKEQAVLLIEAIDPCVAYDLHITEQ